MVTGFEYTFVSASLEIPVNFARIVVASAYFSNETTDSTTTSNLFESLSIAAKITLTLLLFTFSILSFCIFVVSDELIPLFSVYLTSTVRRSSGKRVWNESMVGPSLV
ncbi:hypothetical protein PMAYCL1PPCAC_27030 [Pristionchus mayeri]|uniref:Uncharacterized protein n=1 Tax=Pristionchus mayeri TaxID=1317129 RepID=A0AAN5IA91_9BILA|nr:hypothetical protein PMAYCL1PPCAC_27030 [Pristionchus mayeri]